MRKADADVAAFLAGGGQLRFGRPMRVGVDPPILVVFSDNPVRLTTCFPDGNWF